MSISTDWILKYAQQCYVKWFWTISSLGAPGLCPEFTGEQTYVASPTDILRGAKRVPA